MAKKLISIDDSKTGEAALPEAVNTALRATYVRPSQVQPMVADAIANDETVAEAAATAAQAAVGDADLLMAPAADIDAGDVQVAFTDTAGHRTFLEIAGTGGPTAFAARLIAKATGIYRGPTQPDFACTWLKTDPTTGALLDILDVT